MKREKKSEWKGALKAMVIVAVLCAGIGIAVAAWDDTKNTGDALTAAEWNNMTADQKTAFKQDGSVPMTGDFNLSIYDIKTTNLVLKESGSTGFAVFNSAEDAYRDLRVRDLYAYDAIKGAVGEGGELYIYGDFFEYSATIGLASAYHVNVPGYFEVFVPNAAKNAWLNPFQIVGATDTPIPRFHYPIEVDVINENTTNAGVIIDTCLIKDGYPYIPNHTPSSASDTCAAGQICYDSNYTYVCIATNTWERAALSSW